MQPVNPFGVYWPVAGQWEVIAVLVMLLATAAVFIAIRYIKDREQKRIHNNQLFLFQIKRKGLSNFQIKILNNMVSALRLSDPTKLVTNSLLFESSLAGFCDSLPFKEEDRESTESMCRDLALMYEKLYVKTANRKPLAKMDEIEPGQILYFTGESGSVFLGKVTEKKNGSIAVTVFGKNGGRAELRAEQPVTLFLLRVNDAEYSAKTVIKGTENGTVLIALTDQFVMDREYRHPYINAILPVTLIKIRRSDLEQDQQIEGTIFRINEYECVVRTSLMLEYERSYSLVFEIMDYKFNIDSKTISSRTVESEKVYYFTMKFDNMTEPAREILRRYISDHM